MFTLRKIQRQFDHGIVHEGWEYWVDVDDIIVPKDIKDTEISDRKLKIERNYLNYMGLYKTKILLDRRFNLLDGYISIVLAKENGEKNVPVYFVDRRRRG